jgi:hypothetical protein
MVLCLSYAQSAHLAVEANKFVVRVFFLKLSAAQQSAVELDRKNVGLAWLEESGYVYSVTEKHIVTLKNSFAIQSHVCKGIEAIE